MRSIGETAAGPKSVANMGGSWGKTTTLASQKADAQSWKAPVGAADSTWGRILDAKVRSNPDRCCFQHYFVHPGGLAGRVLAKAGCFLPPRSLLMHLSLYLIKSF